MTNNIYTLLNSLSGRYGEVYSFPTDAFAVSRLSTYLQDGQKLDLKEFSLFRSGTIDIETGVINGTAPIPVPWQVTGPIESEVK